MARRHTPAPRGARRQTLWLSGLTVGSTLTPDGATLLTTLNAAALALRPFTIVRTRGIVVIGTDNTAGSEF